MDLSQKKLTKAEWLNVEIPVVESEKRILDLISNGYRDTEIRSNNTQSLLTYMKLGAIPNIHEYTYDTYFAPTIRDFHKKYIDILGEYVNPVKSKHKVVKKGDIIRINNTDSKMKTNKHRIFEYILLDFCKELLQSRKSGTSNYAFYLYTLMQILKNQITDINIYVRSFIEQLIQLTHSNLSMQDVLSKSYEFIEKNPHLLKFADQELFDHQKQIFNLFSDEPSKGKLVLYTAPTGTGKTLTPIGLAQGYRIIFICAARHIGLALAKSAISVEQKIAIAFGCDDASDIRLHYYAASDYTRNKRSGGIGKVNNLIGNKVQIMICDVKSYIIAMEYMLSFSTNKDVPDEDIITYWDEPTISMDYETHQLHEQIKNNWQENQISKVVLSCATLPKEDEIEIVLTNYRNKFENSEIHTINSYDCRKSISLLNSGGKSVLPHLLYADYSELQTCVQHCNRNKSLLRYFDLVEVVKFIKLVHATPDSIPLQFDMEVYFSDGITSITMNSLKTYYLELLAVVNENHWSNIQSQLASSQKEKFSTVKTKLSRNGDNDGPESDKFKGVRITTSDAHTLTDGPTIYLVENVELIARFYASQSKIPDTSLQYIMRTIERNNVVQKKITLLENDLDEKMRKLETVSQGASMGKNGKGAKKIDKKCNRDNDNSDFRKIHKQLDELRELIDITNLDPRYIPNTIEHQNIWTIGSIVKNAFSPRIDDESVKEIMMLDVTNEQKILLLMGIGMFLREENANPRYLEIMKKLAYQQQLYIILASSDYIYGTNYQFCHGFIGKDLGEMTQQKTIQALGRIGRNQTQQEYTVRFRNDVMLRQLFHPPTESREAIVMSSLFS
jgi:hypothetical protein